MAALDNYIERKSVAITERQQDWTANPDKAIVSVKAQSKVAGITGARPTRMGDHLIISDSAAGLAGHSLGPTAPEMLMGALASCLVHTYLIQATLLHIPLDNVEVDVSGRLDYRPVIGMDSPSPPLISGIRYVAHIESPAADDALTNLHSAVELNCPVLNTLRFAVNVQRNA